MRLVTPRPLRGQPRSFWVHERHLRWRYEVWLRYALVHVILPIRVREVLRVGNGAVGDAKRKVTILADGKLRAAAAATTRHSSVWWEHAPYALC